MKALIGLCAGALAIVAAVPVLAQQLTMTFFVTGAGPGKGGDLGGLEGADRHCAALAQAAGSTGKTWRAYLSTQAEQGKPAINAKDRIGNGPWVNAKGAVIAKSVADLHSASNSISKATALSEMGAPINQVLA